MTITHTAAVFWECGRINGFTNGAAGNYLGWVRVGATGAATIWNKVYTCGAGDFGQRLSGGARKGFARAVIKAV